MLRLTGWLAVQLAGRVARWWVLQEARALRYLHAAAPGGTAPGVVQLLDSFTLGAHYCLVTGGCLAGVGVGGRGCPRWGGWRLPQHVLRLLVLLWVVAASTCVLCMLVLMWVLAKTSRAVHAVPPSAALQSACLCHMLCTMLCVLCMLCAYKVHTHRACCA